MKHSCTCGRPIDAGWTDEEEHAQCAICEVEEALEGMGRPHRHSARPTIGICRMCKQERRLVAFRQCMTCYQQGRRAWLARAE